MLKSLRVLPVLPFALTLALAQDPAAVFEKAPPDVDAALRARVTQFYQYFVDGKFRQADALVADDSKDTFFAAEKRRYRACALGNVTYSDNYTKAKVVTSCDTDYFFAGSRVPIKLPIVSTWKIQNGEWFWYVIPPSEQETYDTPFGPMRRPKGDQSGSPGLPQIPDPGAVLAQVKNGVRVDRDTLSFDGSKSSKEEIHVKNTLPGRATITAEFSGMPGFSVSPATVDLTAGQEATIVFAFNVDDSKVCKECSSHPQARAAGTVTLRVEPTGQQIPVHVNMVTPSKNTELPLHAVSEPARH